MDLIQNVRALAPDRDAHDEQLAAARARLESAIAVAGATRARPTRRRTVRWAGGVLGAAAVVAAGIVVAVNLVPMHPGGSGVPPAVHPPAASAAELLQQTAGHVSAGGLVAGPGQYLRVDETDAFTEYAIEDAATGQLVPAGNRANALAAFVTERTTHLYVPADRSGEWVWDLRGPWSVTRSFGDRAGEAVATWKEQRHGDTPQLWRLPGGRAPGGEAPDATLDQRELFASMPRDAAALLEWMRARTGLSGQDADRQVVWTIANALTTNLAPHELRAAMFRALALIDGIRVDHRGDGSTTYAYAAASGDWTRTATFTVDDERALVTGVTDVSIPAAGSIVPASVPDESRSVSVAIVDTAP